VGKNYIDIMSVDMVDGTPVLDVKPYIPYDIVNLPDNERIEMAVVDEETGLPLPPPLLRVPRWIFEADVPLRPVQFSEAALNTLSLLQDSKKFQHCKDKEDAMRLVREVLRQDIRGSSSRGKDDGAGDGVKDVDSRAPISLYECKLDSFVVKFRTLETCISVEEVSF
jgi:hypothetical protein